MAGQQKSKTLKDESAADISASLSAPSFNGRLNLSSFTFSLDASSSPNTPVDRQNPRKSPRILSTPKPSSTTLKRKLSTADESASFSPSPSKKAPSRSPSSYASPSLYAHLSPLPDILAPNLLCVFVGLNPGIQTARSGHAYAHPSNRFWKLLYSSGCTTRLLKPEEDGRLPELYSMGNTNIVERPTRNGSELSKQEMDASVEVLEQKIRKFRPESVAFVGKSIWESVWRVRKGRAIKKEEFKYGWQTETENFGVVEGEEWEGARVFVASSTSGLAAALSPAEREHIWKQLGTWIEQRRRERLELDGNAGSTGSQQEPL